MPDTRTRGQVQTRGGAGAVRETPLPWGKLSVLLAVRLTEPVGYTLILPFMYQMVGDFDIVRDSKDIAFYAGLLLTSYQFLRTLTIMHWGILSDRIGRRPVVLMGMLGDLLTFVLFGVSKSFGWALVARSLNGFFTGSGVVIKSIIAEISDDTNRGRMMAMFPLMWHLGSMLGGAIGGLLVDPVKNYPSLFGNSVLFREYPYLLPCLVGASISLFGLVVGYFQLEETLVIDSCAAQTNHIASETTPLVSETHCEEGRCRISNKEELLSKWDILTPAVVRVLVTDLVLCLAVSMQNQLYPIFAATDIADGGLGMDAQTIGYTFMLCGALVVYMQLAVYPKDERKHGALSCYRRGLLWLAVFGATFPFLSILAKHLKDSSGNQVGFGITKALSLEGCLFLGILFVELCIRMYGDTLAFTSINILVANVAPRKNYLGFVNGLQHQVIGITYMLGPLISGYLWSWSIKHSFPYPFNSHLVWVFGSVALVFTWYLTLKLPDSVNIFASGSDEQNRATTNDSPSNSRSEEPS